MTGDDGHCMLHDDTNRMGNDGTVILLLYGHPFYNDKVSLKEGSRPLMEIIQYYFTIF